MCDGLSKDPFIKSAFLKQQRNTCWKFPASKEKKIATLPSCQHEGQNESSMQWWQWRGTESCLRVDLNWHWMAAEGHLGMGVLGGGSPSCLVSSRARALATSQWRLMDFIKNSTRSFPTRQRATPWATSAALHHRRCKILFFFFYFKQAQGRECGGGLKTAWRTHARDRRKI